MSILYQPSTSPLVQEGIKYLMALGAPAPEINDRMIDDPLGNYPLDTLTFGDSIVDAALLALYPPVVVNQLYVAGVLQVNAAMAALRFKVPSVDTTPVPAGLPAKSSSPIGAKVATATAEAPQDNVGDHYYVAPYWYFSVGTLWTDLASGRQYVLAGAINPFGSTVWWVYMGVKQASATQLVPGNTNPQTPGLSQVVVTMDVSAKASDLSKSTSLVV